jgi:polyisoprenoid-binding protein YceI
MKRRYPAAALVVLAFAFGAPAFAAESYKVDPVHSSAIFRIKHANTSYFAGRFNAPDGSFVLDEADPSKSSFNIVLSVDKVDTANEKRDAHLKSPDFFDVAKYPTITFKSTKVAKAGKDKFKVTGDLTMHGVTKPVVLDVTSPSKTIKDPWGNTKRGAKATTVLKRRDFGLKWDNRMQDGNAVVGDEVTVTLNLELAEAPVEGAAAKPAEKPAAAAPATTK